MGDHIVCDGAGDTDGGHCCWINGEVCEFLDDRRCSIWDDMPNDVWRAAPIGRLFSTGDWVGFTCRDWPQNMPQEMEAGRGLCCWRNEVR